MRLPMGPRWAPDRLRRPAATHLGLAATLALLFAAAPSSIAAQSAASSDAPSPATAVPRASPYVPLDDPALPLFEHLVARGDVEDPSPMVRPFRRADAVRVLAAADTAPTSATGRIVAELRARWTEPAGPLRWALGGSAGGQAYTHARRDPLHPAGDGGARPYVDVTGEAVFDRIVLATRPVIEPRLKQDPDWPGRRDVTVLSRVAEGYASAQFRYGSVTYGQLQRNWGPVGLPGFPLSDYAYERQGLAFEAGTRTLRLSAFAGDLRDDTDSLGQVIHRYFFTHRLDARLSRRFHLALWESAVLSGPDRIFETQYRNPLVLGYLANALGLGDRSNDMIGLDATWRVRGRHTLQGQLMIDDFWYQNRQNNRDRWGFTLMGTGPVGGRGAYRALYTQVSALALRTFDRFDDFTDAGVGTGRNFTDLDQTSLFVSWPVTPTWLVTPELTLQRQGEGAINVPYPPAGSVELQNTPGLFIGTVERTWRAALGVSGRQGPLALSANGGFHHVVNADHVPGATRNRFEARVQATLGFRRQGLLRGAE